MSYDIVHTNTAQCLKLILFSVASILGEQEDPSRPLVTCIITDDNLYNASWTNF